MSTYSNSCEFNRKARIILGFLAFAAFLGSGTAQAQSARDINNRLNHLENELSTLNRAVYKGEMPPPSVMQSGSAAQDAGTLDRVQQLEGELRALQGKVEEQSHAVTQMQERLDRALADIEMRLGDLERGGAGAGGFVNNAPATNQGGMQVIQGTAPGAMSTDYPPQPGGAAPGAPAAPADQNSFTWNSNASAANTAAPAAGLPGGTSNDPAVNTYESAFSLLKSGQQAMAAQGFENFLKQYPDHELVPNARYWLGESYYANKKYPDAAKIFAEGYQKDPKGTKAADNLLKLGLSLSAMGSKDEACIALGQLEKDFPTGAGAATTRAKQEMSRLGCS